MGDIAHIVAGQSPLSSDCNRDGVGLPFFQGKAEFGRDFPSAKNWCERPPKMAEAGDLLVSVRAPVGPTNYASERCGIGRGLAAIRPSERSARWLRYWLQASVNTLLEKATGTTFEAITGDVLRSHLCPVPPANVQETIVARIDELFAEIDDGEAALARARDDLATWRKALLKAAVTGELTAVWRAANPPVETGVDLFARIVADRRRRDEPQLKERDKPRSSVVDATADYSLPLPEGWTWARIGDLFDVFVGATPSRSDRSLWEGDVHWVSSGEVGFCRISDTREKINRAALRGSAGRLHPPGTVMLGMIGEGKTRGQVAILDIEAAHNQNCASIRVSQTSIPPEFIYLVLAEQYERTRRSSSGGNQPALNKERVKAIRIALPDASECRVIAEIYGGASEAIDAFEVECVLIDASVATLRQSVLASAFSGELV